MLTNKVMNKKISQNSPLNQFMKVLTRDNV